MSCYTQDFWRVLSFCFCFQDFLIVARDFWRAALGVRVPDFSVFRSRVLRSRVYDKIRLQLGGFSLSRDSGLGLEDFRASGIRACRA